MRLVYLVFQWTLLDLALTVHLGVPSGIAPYNSTRLLVELVHPVQRDNHIQGVRRRGEVVIATASHPRQLFHHNHVTDTLNGNGQAHRNAMPNSGHGRISNQQGDRDLILKTVHERQTHVAPSPLSTRGHGSGHTRSQAASHVDLPGQHGNTSPFPVVHREGSHDSSHGHGSHSHHTTAGQIPSHNILPSTNNGFNENIFPGMQDPTGHIHGQPPFTQSARQFHGTRGVPSANFGFIPSTRNAGFPRARTDVMPPMPGMDMGRPIPSPPFPYPSPPVTFGQFPDVPNFVASPGHVGIPRMTGPFATPGNMAGPGPMPGMTGPLATPGNMARAGPFPGPGPMPGMAGPGLMGIPGPLATHGRMAGAGPLARPFMRPIGESILQGIPPHIRRTLISRRLARMGQRMGRLRRHLHMLDSMGV